MQFKKKIIAGALAAGLVMGAGGIAAAYFTTTGSAVGSGAVGAPGTWKITFISESFTTGNAIYPGTSEHVATTVMYNGHGNAKLQTLTVAFTTVVTTTTGGNAVVTATTGTGVTGCHPAWWSPAITQTGVGTVFTAGQTVSETVTLTLNTSKTTQNACANAHPKFTVSAT